MWYKDRHPRWVEEEAESREGLCPLPVWNSALRMPCANTVGLQRSEVVTWHVCGEMVPDGVPESPVTEKGSRSSHMFPVGDEKVAERERGEPLTMESQWLGRQDGQVTQSCPSNQAQGLWNG